MTPIRAPKAARALLATVAGGVLLAGCGAAGGAVQGAGAAVPTSNAVPTSTPPTSAGADAAAPAASPVATTRTTGPRSTQRRTSQHATSRTTPRAGRPTPTPAPTTARPTRSPTPRPTTRPAPSSPPSSTGLTSDEARVLTLVNKERASAGCGALKSNAILVSVARAHSKDMAVHGYFDHNSQDGRSPFDRMRAAGYRGGLMGENIAAGQSTAAAVMDAWMHSPGHRANILKCGFKVIGIGVYKLAGSPFRIYWTQDFGDR
jgi:uncharacterized protein YkwD